jgi:ADP-ribose pyrophosphatase YjhB (NUDIX family)
MPTLGVNIAIFQDDKVLLTQRSDFEVWCLPGGEVDPGESLAQAARREAREETGLEVELTRLVGVYSRPGWLNGGMHVVLFAGRVVGGTLVAQESEVLHIDYFRLEELPDALVFGHRQRILDAMQGVGGSAAWVQAAEWPFPPSLTRQELYDRQARSGLSKREFYQQFVGRPVPNGEVRELDG